MSSGPVLQLDRWATEVQGDLNVVTIRDGVLTLAGWAASADAGAMDGFKITCGGREITPYETAIGLPSADVQQAHPMLARSGRCRFSIRAALAGQDEAEAHASFVTFVPLFQGREGKALMGIDPMLPLPPDDHISLVGGGFARVSNEFFGYFVQLTGLQPTESVLDVGCGTGRMAYSLVHYLAPEGRYDGFDIVERLIAWSQSHITPRFPNFHFRHVDLHNKLYNGTGQISPLNFAFPYLDASVDLVFLTSVFTHMQSAEVQWYLDEIYRVLKPGGRCLCTCFLLTGESMDLIRAGKSTLDIRHRVPGSECFTANPDVPESAIGYEDRVLLDWIDGSGFVLTGKYAGRWCGRAHYTSYQDMLILQTQP